MAHFVRNELCICCGVCVCECPNGAFEDSDTEEFPVIEKEKCDDCGACAEICPAQAIYVQR